MALVPFNGQLDQQDNSPKGLVPFNGNLDGDSHGLQPFNGQLDADLGTAVKSSFAGVGNTVDQYASGIMGALASVGSDDAADSIFDASKQRIADRNQWSNPDNKKIGFGGKVAGAAATIPMQILSAPLSVMGVGQDALDQGETMGTAEGAMGVDTTFNALGYILGPGKTLFNTILKNAGANAAQSYISQWVRQQLMSTDAGKKANDPKLEDALVSAIVGGATAGMLHQNPEAKANVKPTNEPSASPVAQGLDALDRQKAQAAAATVPEATPDGIAAAKAAYEQALRERQLAQQSAFNRAGPNGEVNPALEGLTPQDPMSRMATQLGADPTAPADTPMSRMAADLTGDRSTPESRAAQDAIEARQREMEQGVKRQTSLDMNANERARQENASTNDAYVNGIPGRASRLLNGQQGELFGGPAEAGGNEGLNHGPNPFGTSDTTTHWVTDENGMPIRADRSMEAQNVQEPLQRNLWGDELPQQHEQENPSSLTQAIDNMPPGSAREAGVSRLRSLWDGLTERRGSMANREMGTSGAIRGRGRSQRGVVNPDVFAETFRKTKDIGEGFILQAKGVGNGLNVTIHGPNGEELGGAVFNKTNNFDPPHMVDAFSPAVRSKLHGGAAEIYKFVSELGNDIVPSRNLTPDQKLPNGDVRSGGRTMWKGFEESGLSQGRRIPRGQSGVISADLLGINKVHNFIRSVIEDGSTRPVQRILEKFKGMYNEHSLVQAYNQSLDPKGKEHLVMMAPDEFHNLAARRNSDTMISEDGRSRRTSVREGLNTPEGLDDIPYLMIDKNGQVIGHEGRHRMDVLAEKGVEQGPVRIIHKEWRNEPGAYDDPKPNVTHLFPEKDTVSPIKRPALPMPDELMANGRGEKWMNGSKFEPTTNIPNSQRGGINVKALTDTYEDLKNGLNDRLKVVANASFDKDKAATDYVTKNIPEAMGAAEGRLAPPDSPAKIIADSTAPGVSDTPPIWSNVQSGPGLTAAKFKNHPLLQAVSRVLNYAQKVGDFQVRNLVHPLEKFLASMPGKELLNVHEVMKREMFNERRYTPDELRQAGMSDREMQAYNMVRKAFDSALDIQNKARAQMGLDPVPAKEAYLSSNWQGDWHVPILDKNGKLAWYIRTTTAKQGREAIAYLKGRFPDLDITDKTKPEFRNNQRTPGVPNDVMGAYHDMLGFFKDNPEVSSQIQSAMQDFLESKGYSARGQANHFLEKANIRGFEGDRPWLNPQANAYTGLKSQISYLNNAIRWSHTQEAMANIKQVLSNPDVVNKMPNATDYAKTVVARELGIDGNWFGGLENAIAKGMGVSRSSLYRVTSDLKLMTYLQLLVASPAYMIATPLQVVMTAPSWHRVLTNEGFTHNVGATSVKALGDTMSGITSHIAHELGRPGTELPMTDFGRKALQYAEDSGIISKNLFDESGGLGEHAMLARAHATMGWTIGFPEKVARMGAFMSFAHHLEASGKFDNHLDLFRKAEELTDNSMTSFKSFDRPGIVSKLGAAGQLAYTFKSFLFNGFNQLSTFTRMAQRGNVSPLLASVGMYGLMGGLVSLPLVNELDGLWNLTKEAVANFAPKHYEDVQGVGLKGSLISLLPQTSAFRDLVSYGLPSAATGAQLSSRFNLAAIDPEKPLQGIAPVMQEAKEWAGMGRAAIDLNKSNVLSGIYQISPPLVQGNMETRFDAFKGQRPGAYLKPGQLDAPQAQAHIRNQNDVLYRQAGMTSLPEARDKEAAYIANSEAQRVKTAQETLVNRILSAVQRGDKPDIKSNAQAYIRLNPNSDLQADLEEGAMKMNMTPQERMAVKMQAIPELKEYQHYAKMK